jgi:hypothetical protein
MEKEEFASIEEIDAALEKEFASTVEESDADDGLANQESDEDELADDEILDDEEEDEEPEEPKKGKKESQQEYAFAKLREEKLLAERKASEEAAFMKKLAKASGYGDDVEGYRQDLEKRLIDEEAKQHGVTPEVYKELADAKAKLEKFEKEKVETDRMSRSQKFLNTINDVLADYDVDAKEMSKELFASLEKAGYSIETLLSIPQPEFLIKGALYEKLSVASLKEGKIRDSVETKRIKNSKAPVKTMDEMIDEEMVAYAKARGLKYSK